MKTCSKCADSVQLAEENAFQNAVGKVQLHRKEGGRHVVGKVQPHRKEGGRQDTKNPARAEILSEVTLFHLEVIEAQVSGIKSKRKMTKRQSEQDLHLNGASRGQILRKRTESTHLRNLQGD